MTALTVSSLTKSFGGDPALRAVSLSVEAGEMVALIGASGSGKSTLIRLMAGLLNADRHSPSQISVGGRVIQSRGRLSPEAKSIRREVGVVFQQFNLVGRLLVITNVLVGLLGRVPVWRGTLGLFSRAETQRALRALDRVGIAQTAGRRAATLSGGQQQRAAIARALVQEAQIIIADEPIASLDPASARNVMETLAAINRDEGITVVVSLHQVDYARQYCPRTIALREGAVVYDGPSADLTSDLLATIYGAEADDAVAPDEATREAPAWRGRRAGASLATA